MGDSTFQRSFSGGELAPVLYGRADSDKYVSAAKTIKNFIVRREGGISTRPGLRFVSACKTNTAGTKLMRFKSSTANVSVIVEMGAGYFRFYQNGAAVLVTGVAAYNNATAYVIGDLVLSGGVNYYCIAATTGNAPPNGAFWYALTGSIYEIPTPYSLANLPNWTQSGNILTLTNPNVAPYELTFVSLTRWTLAQVTTGIHSSPPTAPVGTAGNAIPAWNATVTYQVGAIVASGGINYYCIQSHINQVPPNVAFWQVVVAGSLDRKYVITTVEASTLEESLASAVVTIADSLEPKLGAANKITWTAPVGITVDSYNVYVDLYDNGVFGFIGEAAGGVLQFLDAGLTPDFGSGPPRQNLLFTVGNDYPTSSAFYQQRRFFGNTNNSPDGVFGSRTGFRSNFGTSTPLQDDDAVTFRLAGNDNHPIRWMLALKAGLILLTDGGEWTMTGGGGSQTPITPRSVTAIQETYVGIDKNTRPVLIGNTVVYVQTRGSVVRELQFAQQVEGLAGRDLTVFATHLFENRQIVATDYQLVPDSIIWCVRDDGVLLGLTYVPDLDMWAWHRHETWVNTAQASFEDVCVAPESKEDGVYVIVARTIGGSTVRYIERLASRLISTFNSDVFYVDSGLSYHGSPTRIFSGLTHLEGQIVSVVADGLVVFNGDQSNANAASFKVTGGTITLPASTPVAIDVHIGLPIRFPDLATLALDVAGSNVRGKKKTVHSVQLLVDSSSRTFYAGPDENNLIPFKPHEWEAQTGAQSGLFTVSISTSWTEDGSVLIRQVDPLPLTIIGILPDVDVGG